MTVSQEARVREYGRQVREMRDKLYVIQDELERHTGLDAQTKIIALEETVDNLRHKLSQTIRDYNKLSRRLGDSG